MLCPTRIGKIPQRKVIKDIGGERKMFRVKEVRSFLSHPNDSKGASKGGSEGEWKSPSCNYLTFLLRKYICKFSDLFYFFAVYCFIHPDVYLLQNKTLKENPY